MYLDGVRCSEHRNRSCIPVLDLRKHNELEELFLLGCFVEGLLLPTEGARITKLTLNDVTMTHHRLEELSRSLSAVSCIKKLCLVGVRCCEHRDRCCIPVLDLQKHNELELLYIMASPVEGLLLPMEGTRIRSLALHNVTMTHHELEQMYLDGVRCFEHRDRSCIPVLDLRKHKELEELFLLGCSVEGLLLPMEGARITNLTLNDVTMAHHRLEELSRSLSAVSCIKKLCLVGVRCSEHRDMSCIPVIDIRKHNELEELIIKDASVEGLLLPMEGTRNIFLALCNVTMAHHGLEELSKSLSSLSCKEKLALDGLSCSEHRDRCYKPFLEITILTILSVCCVD